MAQLLKLRLNVPEVIALQFATGKIVESTIPNAPNQVLFTLCDGRRTFLPLSAADSIREAGIQAMQEFEIVKASANDFRVRPMGAGAAGSIATQAIAQTTQATTNSSNGITALPAPPQAAAPAPPPAPELNPASLKLMSCLKCAIDAAVEAEAYAVRRGLELRFSSEDIRTMANTISMSGGVR